MSEKILQASRVSDDNFEYAWGIYNKVVRGHVEPFLKDGWDDAREKEQFREIWQPKESYFIRVDGDLIGWCAAAFTAQEVELKHFYISEEEQRKGYGTRLLSELLKIWSGDGKTTVGNFLKNEQSQAFAVGLGFEKIGEDTLTFRMRYKQPN